MQKSLYTIGYEGTNTDDFVTTLENAGVNVVVDVRFHPFSRRGGFSKSPLAAVLREHGIDYLHLRELGNPRHNQPPGPGGFEAAFEAHMQTQTAQGGVAKAAEIAEKSPSCLLCYEREPGSCHRNIVARHVAERTGQSIHHLRVEKGGAVQTELGL
ncbi:MAG: DUF488 domain-containing protein [Alphaproteobacteria bacterium]